MRRQVSNARASTAFPRASCGSAASCRWQSGHDEMHVEAGGDAAAISSRTCGTRRAMAIVALADATAPAARRTARRCHGACRRGACVPAGRRAEPPSADRRRSHPGASRRAACSASRPWPDPRTGRRPACITAPPRMPARCVSAWPWPEPSCAVAPAPSARIARSAQHRLSRRSPSRHRPIRLAALAGCLAQKRETRMSRTSGSGLYTAPAPATQRRRRVRCRPCR